jgi:hypothetical protein
VFPEVFHIYRRILINNANERHGRIILYVEIDTPEFIENTVAPKVGFIGAGLQSVKCGQNILVVIVRNEGSTLFVGIQIIVEFRVRLQKSQDIVPHPFWDLVRLPRLVYDEWDAVSDLFLLCFSARNMVR